MIITNSMLSNGKKLNVVKDFYGYSLWTFNPLVIRWRSIMVILRRSCFCMHGYSLSIKKMVELWQYTMLGYNCFSLIFRAEIELYRNSSKNQQNSVSFM